MLLLDIAVQLMQVVMRLLRLLWSVLRLMSHMILRVHLRGMQAAEVSRVRCQTSNNAMSTWLGVRSRWHICTETPLPLRHGSRSRGGARVLGHGSLQTSARTHMGRLCHGNVGRLHRGGIPRRHVGWLVTGVGGPCRGVTRWGMGMWHLVLRLAHSDGGAGNGSAMGRLARWRDPVDDLHQLVAARGHAMHACGNAGWRCCVVLHAALRRRCRYLWVHGLCRHSHVVRLLHNAIAR